MHQTSHNLQHLTEVYSTGQGNGVWMRNLYFKQFALP